MSDPENFLTRWSRRKRAAADESEQPPTDAPEQRASDAAPAESTASNTPAPPPSADPGAVEPAFDLAKLPPLESITAETDIRAFLAPGVPADVRLAALRRAWVADPKVRDFVGLNDYDFDFHTPGAIPGFGSLEMTDALRQEVARIVSAWQPEAEPTAPAASAATAPEVSAAQPTAAAGKMAEPPDSAETTAVEAAGAEPDHSATDQDELIPEQATAQRSNVSAAPQQKHSQPENLQTLARRSHGRALPK